MVAWQLLVGAVLLLQVFADVDAICMRGDAECIDYVVIANNSDYEERQYPATVWVSTSMQSSSLADAMRKMYRKLFYYFDENNVKGMFINTTTPIRTRVNPCIGTCRPTFTMSFLIPSSIQNDPPLPTDQDLYCDREPAKRYIVRKFGGYPGETRWVDEALALATTLAKEVTVDTSHYYLAMYDPPLKIFRRLNEIWMEKITVDNSIDNESF